MNVPLLDLEAQHGPLRSELEAAFGRVLDSNHYIQGQEVTDFESAVAGYLGSKHAIGVSSGTDALLVALMALDIGPGDEVLCPSFTFFATAGCVSRLGATPVFVDVREGDFQLDVEDAARKVTGQAKAIIPVHIFGQTADMGAVMDFAGRHGLEVIEDCAQSMGAKWEGKQAGTVGSLGTFSFFPAKNLGGFGDGGLVSTNDDTLAEKVRVLRAHGSKPKYFHSMVGGNFRLDALQAALLGVKLGHLESYLSKRAANAAHYMELFSGHMEKLDGKVALPSESPGCAHTWNQFTIRVAEGRRDALREHLADHGVSSEIYYPKGLHQQECFSHLPTSACPVTEKLAGEVLSLPVYPEITREMQAYIVEKVASFLEG
jgi:dTDP-4-amino-4,6-dideoxygalactose transaminase